MDIRILQLIFLSMLFANVSAETSKNPKIAIVSLYNEGYKHIGQYSDKNKTRYAKKHNYDIFIYHDTLDTTRPVPWSKILAIQKHLSDYDWIYWSDADSLIMNMNIKLESLIDDTYNMVISKEEANGNLNTGSFLIKNCEWSKKLLQRIYDQTYFINHEYWEQAALGYILKIDSALLDKVKVLKQRALNSHVMYPECPGSMFQRGDFILHFYGEWNKHELMIQWSDKVSDE